MPNEKSTREPIPAIYILGPDANYPEYRDNLLKAFADKKLQEGKDFIIIGDGLTSISEENLRKKIKGRIAANTRIFCDGHGLVENINGVRKHTIQILEEKPKIEKETTTEYLLNILQDEAKEEYKEGKKTKTRQIPIYVDILSCYGGKTKECTKNLAYGSVLQSHATDSHISYMRQNLQTAAANIARHCREVKKSNFNMENSLARSFMHNQCLTIETHNISIAINENQQFHYTSRSPDKANILKKLKEFEKYIKEEKFPKFFEEFVTKVYSEKEVKSLEKEAEKIPIKKYFKDLEYNYSKKRNRDRTYNLAIFGVTHGIPELTLSYAKESSKNPNTRASSSNTFLHQAAENNSMTAIQNYCEKNLNKFLREVNLIAAEDSFEHIANRTPLLIAIEQEKFMMAEFLIEKGADPNAPSKNLDYPLTYSASMENPEIALELSRILIEKGASVNKFNIYGVTPLHVACERNHWKLVELLIEKGADFEAVTQEKQTPLSLAIMNADNKTAEYLLSKGANPNALMSKNKINPLIYACRDSNFELAETLIKYGTNVNDAGKESGNTPLHFAVAQNNCDMVKLLLDNGAHPEIKNKENNSPLSNAMKDGTNQEIRNLLIDKAIELEEKAAAEENKHQKKVLESRKEEANKENSEKKSSHRERHISKKDHTTTEKPHKSHRDAVKESKKEPKSPNK